MTGPKILVLDIETSPNLAHVWSMWKQNVSLSQLQETTKMICFAAKWNGSNRVEFFSDFHHGHEEMISRAWDLWNEADAMVTYNGDKFDLPHLRREFLLAGKNPPSPVHSIDLLKTVKSTFRFTSNKLDHISEQLGLGNKTRHSGHDLWVRCMAGDPAAWAQMRTYNKRDVVLTDEAYEIIRPWISGHPHMGLFSADDNVCSRCGSTKLQRRGIARTQLSSFQRYQCQECGSWSRGRNALQRVEARGVAV